MPKLVPPGIKFVWKIETWDYTVGKEASLESHRGLLKGVKYHTEWWSIPVSKTLWPAVKDQNGPSPERCEDMRRDSCEGPWEEYYLFLGDCDMRSLPDFTRINALHRLISKHTHTWPTTNVSISPGSLLISSTSTHLLCPPSSAGRTAGPHDCKGWCWPTLCSSSPEKGCGVSQRPCFSKTPSVSDGSSHKSLVHLCVSSPAECLNSSHSWACTHSV